MTRYPVNVVPGMKRSFTLSSLGITSPSDAEDDQIKLYIRLKGSLSKRGKLLNASGGVIITLEEVKLTDRLTYIPSGISDKPLLDNFELIVLDLAPTDNAIAQSRRIALTFISSVLPEDDAIARNRNLFLQQTPQHPSCFFMDLHPLGQQVGGRFVMGFRGDRKNRSSCPHHGLLAFNQDLDHVCGLGNAFGLSNGRQLGVLTVSGRSWKPQGANSFGNQIDR